MLVVIHNKSKGKQFRTTKRIICSVLPFIDIRLNMGNIPLRVLIQLVKNLRACSRRGTYVQVFYKANEGYHGFKLFEIGRKSKWLEPFVECASAVDQDFLAAGM